MLPFDRALAVPATLGIILLCSIIIKNSILMVDFIQERRREGQDAFSSALGSAQLRYRPILMTAFGTIAGMIPIAMQRAVGLERMSPRAGGGRNRWTPSGYRAQFVLLADALCLGDGQVTRIICLFIRLYLVFKCRVFFLTL